MNTLHRRSALALLVAGMAMPLAAQEPSAVPLVWGERVNVMVSGNTLTEDCNGCGKAGAVSRQTLAAGDGYVEFVVGAADDVFSVGIGSGASNTQIENLEFALRFNGRGVAEIRENGRFVKDTHYEAGQRFRIAIEDGDVKYYSYTGSNRNIIHNNVKPVSLRYPAKVEVLLLSPKTSLEQVVVAAGGGGRVASPVTGGGGEVRKITWTNVNNATANGNTLVANNSGNGGAQSNEALSGDGYMEFTAVETDKQRAVGLDYQNTNNTLEDIDFAIVLRGTGGASGAVAEIRESGVYVGDIMYSAGTRFRIAIENGIVKYYRYADGALAPIRGTDARVANFPVHVDAALYDPGSTIADVVGSQAPKR